MKAVLEEIREKSIKFDKSKWTSVKFGQIAFQKKDSIDRDNADVKFYVKGEHMESEDIHIRQWGELADEYLGPAFIRIFESGDILYGSRRTYLKKVAVANFDGITSNTTFVINANENLIIKELLPFVMLSEGFTQHSIKNSKGSVNPYINWKDIANYEFLLPPKDQQARLAELFLTADRMIESYLVLSQMEDGFLKAQVNKLTLSGFDKKIIRDDKIKVDIGEKWSVFKIKELVSDGSILEIQDGNHGELHPKSSDYVNDGIPFIMANTIVDGELDLYSASKLPKKLTDKLRIGFSQPGDVLLTHKGTIGQVAIVPDSISHEYLMLTPQVTYYRLNPKRLSNRFLFYVFNSEYFQKQLVAQSSQSTRAYIGITAQTSLNIALPRTIQEQEQIANILETTTKSIKKLENHIELSRQLQKSLINQIF